MKLEIAFWYGESEVKHPTGHIGLNAHGRLSTRHVEHQVLLVDAPCHITLAECLLT